jgi:hypothetical protein
MCDMEEESARSTGAALVTEHSMLLTHQGGHRRDVVSVGKLYPTFHRWEQHLRAKPEGGQECSNPKG